MSSFLSLSKEALPEKPFLEVPIEVYYFDTDAGGVVHNIAYLRMVEVARSKLAEFLGWSLGEMQASGMVPVVARTEIDYLSPARLGDALLIHSRLASLEKARFFVEFDMVRCADGKKLMFCRQKMVTVNLASGRPQPVPAVWRERYAKLLEA